MFLVVVQAGQDAPGHGGRLFLPSFLLQDVYLALGGYAQGIHPVDASGLVQFPDDTVQQGQRLVPLPQRGHGGANFRPGAKGLHLVAHFTAQFGLLRGPADVGLVVVLHVAGINQEVQHSRLALRHAHHGIVLQEAPAEGFGLVQAAALRRTAVNGGPGKEGMIRIYIPQQDGRIQERQRPLRVACIGHPDGVFLIRRVFAGVPYFA